MNTVMSKLMILVLVTGFAASTARADDAHVIGRANNEEKKNDQAAANGQITQKQNNKLNRQDQRIKKEARADAAANGGHLTQSEQKNLNRQEKGVNRERARMEKRDAAKNGANSGVPVQPVSGS